MTIALRTDFDAVRVRAAARAAGDSAQACRLLSIAAVYEGKSRAEAALLGGMSRQTLRDWVRRFNAEGPDGLASRKAPGARRRLSAAQLAELAELVETGPDPQTDAWCAGVGLTCGPRSSAGSGWSIMSARCRGFSTSWGFRT